MAEDDENDPMAQTDRVATLPADFACLAAVSQRFFPSGSGFHGSRGEQEGGRGANLSSAGFEHATLRGGSLPAQPKLRESDHCGETACAELAGYGCCRQALHGRIGYLGMGQQRSRISGTSDGVRG